MSTLAALGGWLPFAIVALFIFFLSGAFTLRYQQKRRRDYLVTCVSTISLSLALLTAALLPTDITLVSFMKYQNGTYKDWAQNQTEREHLQEYVRIGYYVLYGLVIVLAFFLNPFMYFYYEEKEEDEKLSTHLCSAMKYTAGFLFFVLLLILVGAFVPQLSKLPSSNSTEWDRFKYLIDHFDSSRVEDSICFVIFSLSLVGFILSSIYTGYGSIGLPISFIRGRRSAKLQQTEIEQQHTDIKNQINNLKNRYPRYVSMPAREKRMLDELEQQESVLCRNEESIRSVRSSILFKCRHIYRPFQIIIGIILLCVALLIFLSLLLSNIDKSIHFVDFKQIFAQGNHTLPNPLDIVVTWTGKFYPANYIVLSCVLIYIILSSLYGLQQIGIYYFCVKMFRFSRGRTKPQALVILCSLLMFIVVAINIFVYLLMPQYTIYGDQQYSTMNFNGTNTVKPCTQYLDTNDCTMTVMGQILLRFLYKVWIFGAAYFIISWLYLAVFLFGCLYKIIRHRESNIQVYTVEHLLDDDEDEPLINS